MSSLVWPDLESLQGAGPDEFAAALRQADMIRRHVEVLTAEIVGLAERAGAHLADGHRNVRAWAKATCNWSMAQANVVKQTARVLHGCETVRQAATDGRLGVDQLHTLARGYANKRAREWFEPCARDLVEHAEKLALGDFCVVARRWESYADPDGSARTHERANLDRDAHVRVVGPQVVFDGHGGLGVGVEMMEIFDRFRDREFAADWQTGLDRYGENMDPSRMARSDAQRRFDALAAIFHAAAGSGRISVDEPLVNIVVDVDTYQHHLATTAGLPSQRLDPTSFVQRRCETVDGHQLAGVDIVAASLAGHVRRVVFDSAGTVVDIGRKRRLFTGPLRDALGLTDRTCMWPGCDLPARQCQGDHVEPWNQGGTTSAANGGPACGHHNRFKQHHGYRTWRDPDGTWHITRPDGTQINAPPGATAGG